MALKIGMEKIPCICVTNRALCKGDFLLRIQKIAESDVADAILLREKDLSDEDYYTLAAEVLSICDEYKKRCILHQFYPVAMELGCREIHLPLPVLQEMRGKEKAREFFTTVGTSVHSMKQAKLATHLQVNYMTAGHIFETDCKKGLPGRGLSFLEKITEQVENPVFGIGGITLENANEVTRAGAAGVCIMSGFMLETVT